jgi:chemosensory pili system protein ChpA (sensor histidine kinase/response regulator)
MQAAPKVQADAPIEQLRAPVAAIKEEPVETDDEQEDEEALLEANTLQVEDISENASDEVDDEVDDEASDDTDVQLWDIFCAEAVTHLETLEEYIALMEAEAPCFEPPSDAVQRAMHTLKGSAHMAEITPIAELAAPFERFIKELRSYHLPITEDILQLLRDAVSYTQMGLTQIENGESVSIPRLHQFVSRVAELRELHIAPLAHLHDADQQGKPAVDPKILSIFMAEEMNLLLDADKIIAQWRQHPHNVSIVQPVYDELRNLTTGAYQAYLPAMAELGEKLEEVYAHIIQGHINCSDHLCDTLNAAHTALLDMVDAIAAGQNLHPAPADIQVALAALLASATPAVSHDEVAQTSYLVEENDVATENSVVAEDNIIEASLVTENAAEENDVVETSSSYGVEEIAMPEVTDELTEEEIQLSAAYSEAFSHPAEESSGDVYDEELEELDLVAASEAERFDAVEALDVMEEPDVEAVELEEVGVDLDNELTLGEPEVEAFDVEEPQETEELLEIEELLDIEEAIELEEVEDYVEETEEIEEEIEAFKFEEDEELDLSPVQKFTPSVVQDLRAPASFAQPTPTTDISQQEDFDPEIVEIFVEEAAELLEDMERALHEWQEDWNNTTYVEELKRCLHTFKGGARLAGLTNLGDLSHDYETMLIDMDASVEINQEFFKEPNDYQDKLHVGVEVVRKQLTAGFAAEDDAAQEKWNQDAAIAQQSNNQQIAYDANAEVANDDDSEAPFDAESANLPTLVEEAYVREEIDFSRPSHKPNVFAFAPKPKPPAAPLPKIPGSEFGGVRQAAAASGTAQVQHLAARRAGPQEVVKVSAELLEELVNLAGETSISRGRMEQQVIDLGGAIGEMDSTIQRLQEQLRRLDIETEAQVVFRQEKMAQHEDFDPLEMDRYSQLQQLSRSLIESASDLMDLKFTLADKTRDTETLLLQQSRINTDLQEGLMRSRMVPFSRLVPRLRRIVRQAATELGKEVDFELDNVEGELDRTVLERMVAPLEHMLRNAVDHGIESPAERAAAGKSATGRIALSLSREGGDVMLRLSDDGRGINLKRVREKAIERGLMSEHAHLSDQDLMQFILHAGFSTAEKVTQISGRGVGMDVVHSEIKLLGGAMFIDSQWGEGSQFTIRLPFTVSVNRALMVQIGEDLYAIPLNTIEGIVRVSPFELEHYYQDPDARFDYAGEHYLVRYLGSMLNNDAQPKLDGQSLPLPVVLVRSTDHTVALQVDRLLGSREIVVKTLGVQFSAVRGVSGATVTGDGSVLVILDLHALIREQLALGIDQAMLLDSPQAAVVPDEELAEKVVMVVDDSVTVRKVTTRFLEREGFRVITAKDGVEALQILQDHIPDVMLLDIEMPRMDGFEVAKNVRTSSRLKDIPIIMITSRTGDKHRERALDLGVNKYMGKPYQEDLLLSNIQELMNKPVT